MKKFLLTTVLLLMACGAMMAAPAKRGVYKTLKLAGGQEVRAMLVGDEYGSFWKGSDGKAYVLQGDCYAPVDEKTVLEEARIRREKANAQYAKRLPATRSVSDFPGYYGNKRVILILVNFADVAFQAEHDNALFQRILNEENFQEEPFVGSVHDYFRDQSNGQFTLNFDIFGPVTLSKERAYYGRHYKNKDDMHPGEMVIEAVNLVKDMVEDWHQYDWDGNGEVDQVYLIHAGNGEADTGIEETIWPHQWDLNSTQKLYGDGTGPVKVGENLMVNRYACNAELNKDNHIMGIGLICHEFSHCLGFPDFYDTTYSGGQGMEFWDIMAVGNQLINGYHPAGYTSYERWKVGWLEPIVLENSDTTITGMKPLQEGGECYIVYNKGNRNEYYLIENRQYTKWDACLPGRGLLILHVDEDDEIWRKNKVNSDYSHQRMTRVPAYGLFLRGFENNQNCCTWGGMKCEPFPFDNVNAFNRSFKTHEKQSKRAAWLYHANADGTYQIDSSIENITQNADGTISFNFVAAYSGEVAPEDPPKYFNIDGINGYLMAQDGSTLTGTSDLVAVVIDEGATVTLQGVTILGYDEYFYPGISCLGDATIILASGTENTVRGAKAGYPGIFILPDKTLTIKGDGQLTASSNGNGAGIGGGKYLNCGNIRIEGGTINATGGLGAAGIGGGYGSACGDITITTGVTSVTASTEGKANSIGASAGYGEDFAPCGTVTIGGVVTGSISENPYTYIPTHIKPVTIDSSSDEWYTLDGRRLNGIPSRKGIYIRGNKIVILNNE